MCRPWKRNYFDCSVRYLAIFKRRAAPIARSPSPRVAAVYGSGVVFTLNNRKSELEASAARFRGATKKYRSNWLMLIMGLIAPAVALVPCAIAVKEAKLGWAVLSPKIAKPSFVPPSREDKPIEPR